MLDLAEKDYTHITKFRSFLGDEKLPITKGHDYKGHYSFRACFSSIKMVNDLAKHGVTTNKSFTLEASTVDSSLQKHYIRGLVDGDGSFSVHRYWHFSFISTFDVCYFMQNYLISNIGVNRTKISLDGRYSKPLYVLQYTGSPARLYDNAVVYLDRKKLLL